MPWFSTWKCYEPPPSLPLSLTTATITNRSIFFFVSLLHLFRFSLLLSRSFCRILWFILDNVWYGKRNNLKYVKYVSIHIRVPCDEKSLIFCFFRCAFAKKKRKKKNVVILSRSLSKQFYGTKNEKCAFHRSHNVRQMTIILALFCSEFSLYPFYIWYFHSVTCRSFYLYDKIFGRMLSEKKKQPTTTKSYKQMLRCNQFLVAGAVAAIFFLFFFLRLFSYSGALLPGSGSFSFLLRLLLLVLCFHWIEHMCCFFFTGQNTRFFFIYFAALSFSKSNYTKLSDVYRHIHTHSLIYKIQKKKNNKNTDRAQHRNGNWVLFM